MSKSNEAAFQSGADRARQQIANKAAAAGVKVENRPKPIVVQWRDKQGEIQDKVFGDPGAAETFAKHDLPRQGATQIKVIK